ncbi:hypothetical protein SLS62_000359 [Diatrype stigma]|uniref:Uncharacterized protein n=1 Tax=Diatrype stigma TaxID=117547 RepID=A0AAN9V1J5_9PEZI
MAEASHPPPSPRLTPKRKRDDLLIEQNSSASPIRNLVHLTKPIFSFQSPNLLAQAQVHRVPEDGSSSPRSKVAQKFQNLTIVEDDEEGESGGGVTAPATNVNKNNHELHDVHVSNPSKPSPETAIFGFDGADRDNEYTRNSPMEFQGGDMQMDDEDSTTRKRIKSFGESQSLAIKPDLGTGPNGEDSANAADLAQVHESGHVTLQSAVDPTLVKLSKSPANGRLQKSYPSINRLQDSKSRNRKRAGTPPASKRKPVDSKAEDEPPEVIEPIRAALTWHEDEITVYDPEDKDDDRRGMDGVGFKPSPAIAYQREQMRRRQLAEYRRREENDARARRNQRRREQLGGAAEMERKHSIVRVHFSEAEPATAVTT